MITRFALFAASLAAALVVAVGMALSGIAPAADPAPAAADTAVVEPVAATDTTTPAPAIQVDTVYLTPQATPKVVHVTKVVKTKVASSGGGEHEGGEGDD